MMAMRTITRSFIVVLLAPAVILRSPTHTFLLLRAGASLDGEPDDEFPTAEDIIRGCYNNQDDEIVIAMKTIVAGVRKYGTYKKYMRAPHREFLAVRGLAQRGNLAVQDWHSDTFRETWALEFLARLGDNGVVWHVLTYWRPTE